MQDDGSYKQVDIDQPEDRGILLKDVLLSGEATEEMTSGGKSYCVTARYSGAVAWNSIERKQKSMVLERHGDLADYNLSDKANTRANNNPRSRAFKRGQEKSGALLANQYKQSTDGLYALRPCKLKENPTTNHLADATDINGQDCIKRVYGEDGKAPTLTTCTGGHRQPKVLTSTGIHKVGNIYPSGGQNGNIYSDTGKSPTLSAGVGRSGRGIGSNNAPKVLSSESTYRKLTPLECERLQTVEDDYTRAVSNTQRYKMLGNGFTIEVIAHILRRLEWK